MSHDMNEFTKKVSSTLLKKTSHALFKKITMSDSVRLFICNRLRQLVPI